MTEAFLVITADAHGRGSIVRVDAVNDVPATVDQLLSAWKKIERIAKEVNAGERDLGGRRGS